MFNGYHEPSGTAYNDLEVDRGKKKWPCGNGTNIQSPHLHSQNHQTDIWCSKSPYIGLPNSLNTVPKCNCPSCYQLPENQSYQGDLSWHRSWLSRSYPAPMSQDLVKLQANHHWENACFPAEAYGDNAGNHYVQETGDKPLFYKSYSDLRHADLYQPGVISSFKTAKITRKEDFPKQDENEAHFSSPVTNPSCSSFRSAVDRRRIEEESGYSNQHEKFLNIESSRQQRTLGPYHLHPNRRAVVESFPKTVPSNTNQNRVPSIGHHNIKDNVFHSYIDQNNINKISSYNANQTVVKDKHYRSLYQPDVTKGLNPGQENLRSGLLNTLPSAPVDYHSISFNRDFQNTLDKDFQKYMNSRNPQFIPRNNISDVIIRNCQNFVVDPRKDYSTNRKGVINSTMGNVRAAQEPSKYMEVGLPKSPNYGKLNSRDCSVSDRISSDLKLMINPNGKESFEAFQKGDDNIIHSHFVRPQGESSGAFAAEKGYCSLPLQNTAYKGSRRPELAYRDIQLPYDHPNGTINLKNNTPMAVNQEPIPNFSDIHNGLDAYNRLNNNLTYDSSFQHFEKMNNQAPSDNKVQPSLLIEHQTPPNFFGEPKKARQSEKEDSGKISHLESIRYEELCKNGTSKISPLRLLRKKKFTQQKKEEKLDTPPQDVGANSKNASSPIDVRRFWATWAEEEEDNVPQTQMVVLDCHNIDPEQAGLLQLYNPEPIRTIHLDETSLLDVKSSQFDSPCEQNLTTYRTFNLDNSSGEKISDGGGETETESEKLKDQARKAFEETKYTSGSDLSFGMTLVMDTAKEPAANAPDLKLNSGAAEYTETTNNKIHALKENAKPFDIFKHCEKNSERVSDDCHALVKHRSADHAMSCDNSEISTVLKRDDLVTKVANEDNINEIINEDLDREEANEKYKDLTPCSDSSDDSQAEDISALSNLPTSEYRKNKFLDYSGESCNGSFSLKSITRQVLSKEDIDVKNCKSTGDVEKKFDALTSMPRPSEIGPNDFEIDEILQKLSDINVQSPNIMGKDAELISDIPQKLKTDRRIIDKKERKTKKLSQRSSRTDQLTVENISLNKPTIKFSIQKSHDLKISLKVLNNQIKCDKHNLDDDNLEDENIIDRGYSTEDADDDESTENVKKNGRRLITLKLKGLAEEKEKFVEGEDQAKKCRKFIKKKKIRLDRPPSPKTPVLKIKKNRYMLNDGEEEEDADRCSPSELQRTDQSENLNHGDFQVHETVDSAKIKLTFKRNKNNNGMKKCSEVDEITDVKNEVTYSEYSLVTGLPLENAASPHEDSNGMETLVSPAQDQNDVLEHQVKNEVSDMDCTVNELEDSNFPKSCSNNEELVEENSKIQNDNPVSAVDSTNMPSQSHENFFNEFEKNPQPVLPTFVYDSEVRPEKEDDYLLNNATSETVQENKMETIPDLPSFHDEVTSLSEGEGINCDGILEEGEIQENEEENVSSKQSEGDNGKLNEDKESISKFGGGDKMESGRSEKDVNEGASEKYETEDIDMEVSFITSLEKLSESRDPLKSEDEVRELTDLKSPFGSENDGNSFTDNFEKQNSCNVDDTIVNELDHQDSKVIKDDFIDEDTKSNWPNMDNTIVELSEDKKEIILSDICDPLRELSEEKLANDLMAVDSSDEQNENDVGFEMNIETSNVSETLEKKDNENYCSSVTGTESMYEVLQKSEQNEKHCASQHDSQINDLHSIGDYIIDPEMENKLEPFESIQEKVGDVANAVEATSMEEEFSVASQGSYDSHYLHAIDDNNNNDSSTNNNNSNQGLLQKENIFITRTILRRCSCEEYNQEQNLNTRKLRFRSKSLNINITLPECDNKDKKAEADVRDTVQEEIPFLDIPVSDIPLPPGEAPPGNCLNLEEYIKSKFLKNGNDGNTDRNSNGCSSSPLVDSHSEKKDIEISRSKPMHECLLLMEGQGSQDIKRSPGKESQEISSFVENSATKKNSEQKYVEALTLKNQEKADTDANNVLYKKEEEKGDSCEAVSTVKSLQMDCKEIVEELSEDLCTVKLPESCFDYSENMDEPGGPQDTEIDLGGSSFRTDGLYEYEGLSFDEPLTISDDMEEEKVSDDDKFRNIMQNCLENAKKFLSVGKLFSCSRDDFLEMDCYEDQSQDKKEENHISKDVLLASCEMSASEDLVLVDHQSSDISLDFVPSFFSDTGSNLCPEILPVDNWPYLEEEVASSPLRNKQEDSDLLSSCIENNFPLDNSPSDNWCLLDETNSEYTGQRTKNKSRSVSVCVTDSSALFKATEKSVVQRRRTIESVGRWKSFHNSNEELAETDDVLAPDDAHEKCRLEPEEPSLKKELTSKNERYSKKSKDIGHNKSKKRILPYGVTDRHGKNTANLEKVRSDRANLDDKSIGNSNDCKSSLWQPKLVLFRISKNVVNNLPLLPNQSKKSDSSHKEQTRENKNVKNKNDRIRKLERDNSNPNSESNKCVRNVREHSVDKTAGSEFRGRVDRIREIQSENVQKKPRSEKPTENASYKVKRKRNRFRNLYTKKRNVPDAFDLTKDKSAMESSTSLVDSEESSPERDLPKPTVFSHCKSTKSISPTKTSELSKEIDASVHHSNRTEEEDEALKAKRKHKEQDRQKSSESDPSRHSYKSRDNKRKRENSESKYESEHQRKKERNHTKQNEHVDIGSRKSSEWAGDEKSKKVDSAGDKVHNSKSRSKSNKQRHWKCEVCGFSKSSERAIHIQSHPFHCQSCHLAFKAETSFLDHLTRKHKDIRNQHHCLLCELSFDFEKDYYSHLETREHKHLESVEKNTINTLFTLLTGHPCPVLGPVESKPEWLPTQAGTVHFYHQATPLSLALQYLKLHRDKTSTLSTPIE